MKVNGIKTIDTINGIKHSIIEGDLAIKTIKINTTNPYGIESLVGTVTIYYDVLCNGELIRGECSPCTINILDIPLSKQFNNITYINFLLTFKEYVKDVISSKVS
jgi:hypothetical protein